MTTQVEAVEKSNLDTPPEYWVVCDGLEIKPDNGNLNVTIKNHTKVRERVKGDTFATWVIMGNITYDNGTPFREWGVFMLTAGVNGWSLFLGDYFATEEEALTCYHKRMGLEG